MLLESLAGAGAIWVWEKYGKELIDSAGHELKGRWSTTNWRAAASRYAESIRELYGTTWVLGRSEPLSLEDIYTDLFIMNEPTATRRFDIHKLLSSGSEIEQSGGQSDRMPALRVVDRSPRLYILGRPGAGKTTFLRHVALKAAAGEVHGRHRDKTVEPLTPIFVTLKDWADADLDLGTYIASQFKVCGFPEADIFIDHLLSNGRAIVLFDGLDEVGAEKKKRADVISGIRSFTDRYRDCKFAVTCRVAASEYIFERFKYVEVADFTEAQIRTYVRKWFGDRRETLATRFLEELAAPDNRGIRELANTPLLLSLLCIAFEDNLTFPQRRLDLYEQALDALLRKWDASRGILRGGSSDGEDCYRRLAPARKHQLFASLAFPTFERGEIFLRRGELADKIATYLKTVPGSKPRDTDGGDVLRAIEAQHGVLMERAEGIYSFSHLTFQEYYAAKYVVDTAGSGALDRLVAAHAWDQRWREVFLLVASMLLDADAFVELLVRRTCLSLETDSLVTRIVRWADQKAQQVYPGCGPTARVYCLCRAFEGSRLTQARGLGLHIVASGAKAAVLGRGGQDSGIPGRRGLRARSRTLRRRFLLSASTPRARRGPRRGPRSWSGHGGRKCVGRGGGYGGESEPS